MKYKVRGGSVQDPDPGRAILRRAHHHRRANNRGNLRYEITVFDMGIGPRSVKLR